MGIDTAMMLDRDHLRRLLLDSAPPPESAPAGAELLECAHLVRALVSAELDRPARASSPPPRLRSSLFEAVDHLERFAPLSPRLAALLGVSLQDARRTLHAFADVERWAEGPFPGMRHLPLTPVGERAGSRALLARFAPDAIVPRHPHVSAETILVFEGSFETDSGRVIRAGEELWSPVGSSHAIVAFSRDIACLCGIFCERDEGATLPQPKSAPEGGSR